MLQRSEPDLVTPRISYRGVREHVHQRTWATDQGIPNEQDPDPDESNLLIPSRAPWHERFRQGPWKRAYEDEAKGTRALLPCTNGVDMSLVLSGITVCPACMNLFGLGHIYSSLVLNGAYTLFYLSPGVWGSGFPVGSVHEVAYNTCGGTLQFSTDRDFDLSLTCSNGIYVLHASISGFLISAFSATGVLGVQANNENDAAGCGGFNTYGYGVMATGGTATVA